MFRLYKMYLKDYKKHVILGPILKMLEAIFELLAPFMMAKLIDSYLNNSFRDEFLFYLILLLTFAILGLISTLFCQYLAAKASSGFAYILRQELFSHIINFSFYEFDKFKKNALLTRLNNDVNQLQLSVSMFIRLIVRTPLIIIGVIIMSSFISYTASLFFIFVSLFCLLFIFLIMRYTIKKNNDLLLDTEEMSYIVKEDFKGAKTIKGFNTYKEESKRFKTVNIKYLKDYKRLNFVGGFLNPLMTLIISTSILFLLYFYGLRFNYSIGSLQVLINYSIQILAAILVLSNLIRIFSRSFASSRRILEVLDTKTSLKEGVLNHKNNTNIALEFQNVSFAYNDTEEVLNDISFKIYNKSKIAFIGETGSGKSTIIKLMKRLYDPSSGKVLLYGFDIKNYTFNFIKDTISLVPQVSQLEHGNILDNLRWGDDTIDPTIAKLALENSCFNFGLEDIVLEGARNLSGGEKQRLSIARALSYNAPIIILDDSLSALDFKTDATIRKNLSKLNKTMIVVSERINSIKDFDMIFVLSKGRIEAYGTHQELLKSSPLYLELYEMQEGKLC